MFCPNCGTQNPDQTPQCFACGQSFQMLAAGNIPPMAVYQPYSPMQDRMNIRNGEMAELNRMIQYFSQKRMQYDEYDKVCAQLDLLSKGKRVGLLVWGIILNSLGLLYLLILLGNTSTKAELFSLLISIILVLFAPGIMLIILFVVTTNARNRNYAEATLRYDQLTNELYQHYLNYGYCTVGCEYTNPSNLNMILQTIQSGRADTTKDAINVLAEENYRRNMQALAMQAARSAAAAARGASTAAVFSAANFFVR